MRAVCVLKLAYILLQKRGIASVSFMQLTRYDIKGVSLKLNAKICQHVKSRYSSVITKKKQLYNKMLFKLTLFTPPFKALDIWDNMLSCNDNRNYNSG